MSSQNMRIDLRVGPDTPLGNTLRKHWIPVCMSSDIAEPDCDPIRVWALGQSFVAFRDTSGRIGVLDEACPHRKASLVFGRNEEGGIRCLWHQWKIDVEGNLMETPNTSDCAFRSRVKANAYPVVESGGLVWAYFGQPESIPALPEYSWSQLPAEQVLIVPVDLDCNFVRPLEGLVDTSHVSLLHADTIKRLASNSKGDAEALKADTSPEIDFALTDFGFHYAAIRKLAQGGDVKQQVRVTAYVFPYTCFISPGDHAHISVPMDDNHTRFYNVIWSETEALDKGPARQAVLDMYGLHDELLERHGVKSTMPPPGPLKDKNHFVQDRAAMRANETFSGGFGLTIEDAVMTVSIGSISDYKGEHLIPADFAVARLRRLLADNLKESSPTQDASGRDDSTPALAIKAPSDVIASSADWRSLVPHHIEV